MDFEKEARETFDLVDLCDFPQAAVHIEQAIRRAFAAGEENMRKHLAEHFHDVSDQAPKHETNLANAAKMVAVAIEQFKIPQN